MEDLTENIPDFQGHSNARGSYLCSIQIKEKDTSCGLGKTSWVGWEMSLFTLQSAGTWGTGKGRLGRTKLQVASLSQYMAKALL